MTPITLIPIPMLLLATTAVTVQALLFRRRRGLPEASYRANAQSQAQTAPRVLVFDRTASQDAVATRRPA